MNLFSTTRLRLTGWYLLIIILINLFFSFSLYISFNTELERLGRTPLMLQDQNQILRQYNLTRVEQQLLLDPQIIHEARIDLVSIIIVTNLFIIIIATGLSYYFAGLTLRPIEEMHLKQQLFVSNAALETKTPISLIRSEIESVLSKKNAKIGDYQAVLNKNLNQIIRLSALTENLLFLASIEGTINPKIVILNIFDTLNEVINKITPISSKKSIKIINNTHSKYIQGNKDEIQKLFYIILENAVIYSNINKIIRIQSKLTKNKIIISVKDRGFGISKKDLPYIFERFYKVGAKSNGNHGFGLGLSIAQSIVIRHSGKIYVQSKTGQGSTFFIELPYKAKLKK